MLYSKTNNQQLKPLTGLSLKEEKELLEFLESELAQNEKISRAERKIMIKLALEDGVIDENGILTVRSTM